MNDIYTEIIIYDLVYLIINGLFLYYYILCCVTQLLQLIKLPSFNVTKIEFIYNIKSWYTIINKS